MKIINIDDAFCWHDNYHIDFRFPVQGRIFTLLLGSVCNVYGMETEGQRSLPLICAGVRNKEVKGCSCCIVITSASHTSHQNTVWNHTPGHQYYSSAEFMIWVWEHCGSQTLFQHWQKCGIYLSCLQKRHIFYITESACYYTVVVCLEIGLKV